MKPVQDMKIVVGVCERKGKYLLLQRKDTNPLWDKKWEFPGGKIDEGELAQDSIVREISEETGLDVHEVKFFHHHVHDWDLPDKILRVHIDCFHCRVGEGVVIHEPQKCYQVKWLSYEEALAMDTLEANADILNTFFHEIIQNLDRGL